jgi:hypothetical protein
VVKMRVSVLLQLGMGRVRVTVLQQLLPAQRLGMGKEAGMVRVRARLVMHCHQELLLWWSGRE